MKYRTTILITLFTILLTLGGMYDAQTQGGEPETAANRYEGNRVYEERGSSTDRGKSGFVAQVGRDNAGTGCNAETSVIPTVVYNQVDTKQEKGSQTVSTSWSSNGDTFRDIASHYDTDVFKITAYSLDPKECGKEPNHPEYGITYSGERVKENVTIAADLKVLPLGTKVMIEGLPGVHIVEDKGGAVKGKHIDVFIPNTEEAKAWGVQKRKVIILEMGPE